MSDERASGACGTSGVREGGEGRTSGEQRAFSIIDIHV